MAALSWTYKSSVHILLAFTYTPVDKEESRGSQTHSVPILLITHHSPEKKV
jgi:hypothetical protein